MFGHLLRSISGSFAELTKWEPSAERSEVALRAGLERSLLFLLCASGILGLSSLTLGISQQTVYCDTGLSFWNGLLGANLLLLAAACSAALFSDTQAIKLAAKLIWTNCDSSFFEFGTAAFNNLLVLGACPLASIIWIARGSIDVTSSPTCRNTAALLYGGTITNITLTISALAFAAVMMSYFIASTKRFYEISILACICDPIGIAVENVAASMPPLPRDILPRIDLAVPSFDECIEKLPTYEKTRGVVKRIVGIFANSGILSLPERFRALMETRIY